jgi:hypothetical protein
MILPDKLALQLVSMWVHRPPECQESFGYLISSFIKDNPFIETKEELEEVLIESKRIANKIAVQYSSDRYLNLSHKTFSSALDNFINCLN